MLIEQPIQGPGGLFPVGETEIRYKFADEAGNEALCTFTVTVIPAGMFRILFSSLISFQDKVDAA